MPIGKLFIKSQRQLASEKFFDSCGRTHSLQSVALLSLTISSLKSEKVVYLFLNS